jgi:hypothetical protein
MPSKKKALALLTLTLLTATIVGLLFVGSANAFERVRLPEIYINSDGTITPNNTGYIARNGNTYTLTADINDQYSIRILCSNIVLDGRGHTIHITKAENINVLQFVTNVTVENLKIHNNSDSLNLPDCYNCTITNVTTNYQIGVGGKYNTVTQCSGPIGLGDGSENLIFKNNITSIFIAGDSSSNRFYENNILLTDAPGIYSDNFWDNGSVGNYWSGYTSKYPGAVEVGNSGIWDTPYTIDHRSDYATRDNPNAINIDHYPLMHQVNILESPQPVPSASPISTATLPAQEPAKGLFLPAYAIIVFAVSVVLAALVLALYKKKKSLPHL